MIRFGHEAFIYFFELIKDKFKGKNKIKSKNRIKKKSFRTVLFFIVALKF